MNKLLFTVLFGAVLSVLFVLPVQAVQPEVKVRDEAYSAKFISQSLSDPIMIEAGSTKTVNIKFKNVGTATWDAKSTKYISAYTMEPRDRKSEFVGDGWISAKQTAKIVGTVKPGAIGELKIDLVAPSKIGEYVEKFYLAAENYSWVKGGYFFLKIKVIAPSKPVVVEPKKETAPSVLGKYEANLFGISPQKIDINGGDEFLLVSLWQNTGKNTWPNYSLTDADAVDSAPSIFFDSSWKSHNIILSNNSELAPGSSFRAETRVRAPVKKGKYVLRLKMIVDGEGASSAKAIQTVEINVLNDAPNVGEQADVFVPRLASEPKIRVGVWKPTDSVQMSSADDCNVYDGATLVGTLPKGATAVLSYSDDKYRFWWGSLNFETSNYIRIEPINDWHTVFTLYNYDHKVSWKGAVNFNQYRGALEYRLSEKGTMYIINEVLFEDYIAGISETSSGAPIEFIKANLVAARSYAYYVKEHTDKHDSRYFDVVGTTGDQLYLGYQSEVLMPRVVLAQQETRGMMVTYDDKIVITPYFGNSNGWTRSYVAAWGGSSKPWLMPVKANYDAGRTRLGHGVGMSQRDCALRAEKEGLDYISLLKYYYTGVEVERIYN